MKKQQNDSIKHRLNARLITYFGNIVLFSSFRHFGWVIFYSLNFRFAHLPLQNLYIKKSKQMEDDQNTKKNDQNAKKRSYQNEA